MNKSQEYKSFEIDAVTKTEHDYLMTVYSNTAVRGGGGGGDEYGKSGHLSIFQHLKLLRWEERLRRAWMY